MALVHLVAGPAPEAPLWKTPITQWPGSEPSLLAVRECAAPDDRVILLGCALARETAAELGLRPHAVVAPPLRSLSLAAPALKAALTRVGDGTIVAWGTPVAQLARLTLPGRRRSVHEVNLDIGRVGDAVLPHRCTTRLATKLTNEPSGILTVGLIGDNSADAMPMVYAAGILEVGGIPFRAFAPRWTRSLRRAFRHVREGGYVRELRATFASSWGALHLCDLAILCPAPGPWTWSAKVALSAALDAGIPAIAPESADARSLLTGPLEACIARSSARADFARVASRFVNQPDLLRDCRRFLLDRPVALSMRETLVRAIETSRGAAA